MLSGHHITTYVVGPGRGVIDQKGSLRACPEAMFLITGLSYWLRHNNSVFHQFIKSVLGFIMNMVRLSVMSIVESVERAARSSPAIDQGVTNIDSPRVKMGPLRPLRHA